MLSMSHRRPLAHPLVAALLVTLLAACGDDTSSGQGGSTGNGTGDGTGGTTANTDAASTTSVAQSSVASNASSTVASSASTGEPEVCPWFGADPGTLVATGAAVGDVIENVTGLIDQCGVARSLWDFAGGYRILSMTTGW